MDASTIENLEAGAITTELYERLTFINMPTSKQATKIIFGNDYLPAGELKNETTSINDGF